MKRINLPYRARLWLPTVKVNDALRDAIEAKAPGYTEQHVFGSDGSQREPVTVFEILYGDDDFEVEPMLTRIVDALLWGWSFVQGEDRAAGNPERSVLMELNGKAALYVR